MEQQNLGFANRLNESKLLKKNKTIIDYAGDYTKSVQVRARIIKDINHARICKKMILLSELVGFIGERETKEFRNTMNKISVMQKVSLETAPKLHKRIVEI